jgi:hypothetical protein
VPIIAGDMLDYLVTTDELEQMMPLAGAEARGW